MNDLNSDVSNSKSDVTLSQLDSFLISTPNAQKNLENADFARILVFSDSHGDKEQLERIFSYFGSRVDALAFCGDGIEDLFSIIEEPKFLKIPPIVAFVRGNNDVSTLPVDFPVSQKKSAISQFVKIPEVLIFKTCGKKILLTHGHRHGVYSSLRLLEEQAQISEADLAFFGHTHIPQIQVRDLPENKKLCMLNPGSVSLPRGYSPKSFALVTVFKDKEKQSEVAFYKIENSEVGDINSRKETYCQYEPKFYNSSFIF